MAPNLLTIYLLKNAKKTCKHYSCNLNRDWNMLFAWRIKNFRFYPDINEEILFTVQSLQFCFFFTPLQDQRWSIILTKLFASNNWIKMSMAFYSYFNAPNNWTDISRSFCWYFNSPFNLTETSMGFCWYFNASNSWIKMTMASVDILMLPKTESICRWPSVDILCLPITNPKWRLASVDILLLPITESRWRWLLLIS